MSSFQQGSSQPFGQTQQQPFGQQQHQGSSQSSGQQQQGYSQSSGQQSSFQQQGSSQSSGQQQQGSQQLGSGNIAQVETRWNLLRISRIDKVEIVNIGPYTGVVTNKLKPGMLGTADLKITFSSNVQVNPNSIAARVQNSTSLFAKEVRVELGYVSPLNAPHVSHPENVSHYSILVPFLRLDNDQPLFDRINLGGSSGVIHYNITIPGEYTSKGNVTCNYYIRLRADHNTSDIEIKYVGHTLLDMNRFNDSFSNLFRWLKMSASKLKNKYGSKSQPAIASTATAPPTSSSTVHPSTSTHVPPPSTNVGSSVPPPPSTINPASRPIQQESPYSTPHQN